MNIKLNKSNNKSLSLSIYNNTALINETRYLPKLKCPTIIEYFDISNFIEENSLIVDNLNSFDISYSYVCCDKKSESCHQCTDLIPNSIIFNFDNIKEKLLSIYYLTKNITWNNSYNIILEKDTFSIQSWFNIINKSGLNIENASIKLIGGDVNLSSLNPIPYNESLNYSKESNLSDSPSTIDNYSVYILENKYDIANNTFKRIPNFNKETIKYEKLYDFGYYLTVADIKILFNNTIENNLGFPLPSGNINTYEKFNDKLEFLGGSLIPNIGIDRPVSFVIGKAFNVTAERNIKFNTKYMEYSIKEINYIITNTLKETVRISISEPIFTSWQIDYSSDKYEIDTNGNPIFNVEILENSKKTIHFTYRYKEKNY